MPSTTCSPRLLRGTIEPVYMGTLVYTCEHNPTVVFTNEHMRGRGVVSQVPVKNMENIRTLLIEGFDVKFYSFSEVGTRNGIRGRERRCLG